MTTTVAGLSGTFDATTLIAGLVAAEKTPETALNTKITNTQSQISSLGTLVSEVQALGTATTELSTSSAAQAYAATSSDSSTVSASVTDSAQAGNYVMQVTQLASAQTSASTSFATNTVGGAGAGTLTLSTASGSPISINYDSSDSLVSIASKINAQAGGIAQASVLYDGSQYRLVVNSVNTGSAGAITFSESNGSNLGLAGSSSTIVSAKDAQFSVNGLSVTRSSNSVTDVIPGVTLHLSAVTTSTTPVTVTVAPDSDAIASKVNDFVTAFNQLVQSVNSLTTYSGTQLGEDSLFGDPAVEGLRSELGAALSQGYATASGNETSVGAAGITLNSDGTLTVDATKLSTAIAANPNAISDLFVGTNQNGLASNIADIANRYAGDEGQLTTESSQRTSTIQTYQDQIAAIDTRASTMQTELQAQFAKLDSVQAQWSSQASYLTNLQNDKNASS